MSITELIHLEMSLEEVRRYLYKLDNRGEGLCQSGLMTTPQHHFRLMAGPSA